ncbi:IS200/IS605 family transposase [Megamonas hypermegale]|uniref:IS200/IS605 family transposase n=1 Tax=Megamonas hypermegale TaxID=158847 RepID=UPI00195A96C3|nr:IS200/IS605 family transposase [Megamonas hypermegale]MBM6760419.1 IS200/IS605 family transposase [Megamonas hypermegale]
MNDIKSLSHSKWRCKYHIVFAPKYRRQVIYKKIRVDIGKILRQLCERKKVEIIEAECCPNHIHILVAIPPHLSVAGFMGYLKSKSSLMILDRHANLKYKYGNRHFWCRGYYVDTVGEYENAIKEYIKNQLEEDIMIDQISLK